jgi:hypothetical protein
MSRKSFLLVILSCLTVLTSALAAPSADSVMKQTLKQAQLENKNVFLHIGAPT